MVDERDREAGTRERRHGGGEREATTESCCQDPCAGAVEVADRAWGDGLQGFGEDGDQMREDWGYGVGLKGGIGGAPPSDQEEEEKEEVEKKGSIHSNKNSKMEKKEEEKRRNSKEKEKEEKNGNGSDGDVEDENVEALDESKM